MSKKTSPSTTLRINEWEKEFESRFVCMPDDYFIATKAFISDLLDKKKMELARMVENLEKEMVDGSGWDRMHELVLNILETLKSEMQEEVGK